jgi:SAM-dependent methyltransferase
MIDTITVFETVSCAVCGEAAGTTELEARDWLHGSGETFRYVRCSKCGLVYLNPRPVPRAIGRYYPRDSYYTFQDHGRTAGDVIRSMHRRLARQLTRRLGPGFSFDVGCGDGSFMLALGQLGWQPAGIEYDSDTAARLHQKWQLPVVAGDFLTVDLPVRQYDLVSMLEALEHLHEPQSALQRAFDLLKPGGTLFVTVPNIASLEYRLWGADWVALEPPIHLYHFSSSTLSRALQQAGFEVISIRQSASTAGLTRSLWLKLRRDTAADGGRSSPVQYHAGSWRRVAHSALSAALVPVGGALALAGLGPGLRVLARRPA